MKTVFSMIAAGLFAAACLSATAQAQNRSVNPQGGTQIPDNRGNDTNSPDDPGGEDGDGEPSPGGGGGDAPRPGEGDFEPVEVEFNTRDTRRGQAGLSMEEEDLDTDAAQRIGRLPTSTGSQSLPADRVCCRGFYGGAEWSTRAACQSGGGDLAPENICRNTRDDD